MGSIEHKPYGSSFSFARIFLSGNRRNGKAPAYKAWKDTYNLKPRSKVKIAWIPDNRPGRWMYHCHILEHHEAGMMAHFEVVDGSKPYVERLSNSVDPCH